MKSGQMKKVGFVAMVGAAVVMLNGFSPGGCGAPRPPAEEELRQRVLERLGTVCTEIACSAEQKTQLETIALEVVDAGAALREGRPDPEELFALFEADTLDAAVLHGKVDDQTARVNAFGHEVADAIAAAHGVLTPDQRRQVTAKLRERMESRLPFGGP